MAEEQSEYGKGLVICLVKFAEHWERLLRDVQSYKELGVKVNKPDLFSESHAVELSMNGAGDHLFDIEVPDSMKGTDIERMVVDLQDRGLQMRCAYDSNLKVSDAEELFALARQIALAIDKHLGLNAQLGTW